MRDLLLCLVRMWALEQEVLCLACSEGCMAMRPCLRSSSPVELLILQWLRMECCERTSLLVASPHPDVLNCFACPAHPCAVAARGLDVKDLVLVVNYDVPNHHEDYVHRWVHSTQRTAVLSATSCCVLLDSCPMLVGCLQRRRHAASTSTCTLFGPSLPPHPLTLRSATLRRVGRTGRAGAKGTAITFIGPDEEQYAPDLVKALKESGAAVPQDLQVGAAATRGSQGVAAELRCSWIARLLGGPLRCECSLWAATASSMPANNAHGMGSAPTAWYQCLPVA